MPNILPVFVWLIVWSNVVSAGGFAYSDHIHGFSRHENIVIIKSTFMNSKVELTALYSLNIDHHFVLLYNNF